MKINFGNKQDKPKRKNIWDLFWYLIGIHNDRNSMAGFLRENFSCDIYEKQPSKDLIKRYNLKYEYSEPIVWWLLENYFNGNLVEKNKDAN